MNDEIKRRKLIKAKLVSVFDNIYKQRMHNIPVCNKKLEVVSTDIIDWNGDDLCVLITPWFMNLVLLSAKNSAWKEMDTSSKNIHHFPSGRYEFTVGREKKLGVYQSCSLFSPMFEFADLAAAIETADIVLKELMNEENVAESDLDRAQEINDIWNGANQDEEILELDEGYSLSIEGFDPQIADRQLLSSPKTSINENENLTSKTIDRRQLLRGDFSQKIVENNTDVTRKNQV